MKGISFSGALLLTAIALMVPCRMAGQEAKTGASDASAAPSTTFRAFTRMVTVEVVAKDRRGRPIPGLAAKDFRLFEQVPPNREEKEQAIKGFAEVNPRAIAEASKQSVVKMPAGVFSNLVTARLEVPPTILLLDGLNTEGDSGLQARRQMVKMLASIPPDTPVAVFLLGNDLLLLQSFTRDPKLLREVAQRVQSTNLDNGGLSIDAHDDPFSLSNQTLEMFGGDDEAPPSTVSPVGRGSTTAVPTGPPGGELQMAEIRRFEKETSAFNADMRVGQTLDALRAIARHVSGYPGRKNLIWISSSFPLVISPDLFDTHHLAFEGTRNYQNAVTVATNALADAKVSVYPVNPAGVQTQSFYQADKAPPKTTYIQQTYAGARSVTREDMARFSGVESMTEVAKQTGGSICVNNNDLGDCVKTAVEEGSSYYELAYYPDASDWHGEFRRIIVKTARPGVQLSYREGYFAHENTPGKEKEKDKSGNDPLLQEAACGDLLTATSILVVGRMLPPDDPKQVKYYLNVDAKMLTATGGDDGNLELRLEFAVCAFDRSGKAVQYMQDSVSQKFTRTEYSSMRGFPHVVEFAPREGTTRVRLAVRDTATGKVGSVDVSYSTSTTAVPAGTGSGTPPTTSPVHN